MSKDNCTNCEFASKHQQYDEQNKPVVGQYMYKCVRFPPTPVVTMTPQGVQILTMHPAVSESVWCAEHELRSTDLRPVN